MRITYTRVTRKDCNQLSIFCLIIETLRKNTYSSNFLENILQLEDGKNVSVQVGGTQ